MRLAGSIPQVELVEPFARLLAAQRIKARLEQSPQGYDVWVMEDDQWQQVQELLARFLANPTAAEFQAPPIKIVAAAPSPSNIRRVQFTDERLRATNTYVTWFVIAICTLLHVALNRGVEEHEREREFEIQNLLFFQPVTILPEEPFAAIRAGEVWRIITPCLMHGGWMHLIMNMLAALNLGRLLEIRLGVWRYIVLILLTGCLANVAQYAMSYYFYEPQYAGAFLGYSGVLFGYFGYAWARWYFDRYADIFWDIMINRQVIAYYVIWGLFCLTGMLGSIANTAHFSGLAVGFVWGWWHARQPGNV
jgi:GlpG protein